MKSRSIAVRLFSLVGVSAIGLIILTLVAGSFIRSNLMSAKIDKITAVTDSALSIAKSYHDRAKAGEIDEATAKTMALRALRDLRFDGSDYLFGYDRTGLCLLHGSIPAREGQNFMAEKDLKGTPFIKNLIALGLKGGGWTSFYFTRKGGSVPLPKVGYVGYYEPWDWIIGTGVYTDDVDEEYASVMRRFSGLALLILAIVSAFTVVVSRSVSRPIAKLTRLTHSIAAGDLSLEVEGTSRQDEVGELARALGVFRENTIKARELTKQQATEHQAREAHAQKVDTLTHVFDTSVSQVLQIVAGAATELEATARAMTTTAERTSQQSSAVASAAELATSNVQSVALACEELSKFIQVIAGDVRQSKDVSQEAARRALATTEAMKGLSTTSARINDVVGLINDIASQTNLLALNATIEAARAGEAGKGFAVVANEVKQLAGQTSKATDEIGLEVAAVQKAVNEAIQAIQAVVEQIDKVNTIGVSIADAIDQQTMATDEIAKSVQQVSNGTTDISANIGGVTQAAAETGAASEEVLAAAQSLSRESAQLKDVVGQFLQGVRSA
jgi:methyl-accepting chemotaxis protein